MREADELVVDPEWYLLANPDVAAAGRDPVRHWRRHGAAEGRAPSMLFDPGAYLAAYPDVAATGMTAVAHWQAHGRAEGRRAFAITSGPGAPLPAEELGARLAGEPIERQRALLLFHHPRLRRMGPRPDLLVRTLVALAGPERLSRLEAEVAAVVRPSLPATVRIVIDPGDPGDPGDPVAVLVTRLGCLADPSSARFALDDEGPADLPEVRLPAGSWPAPGAVSRLAEDVGALGRDPSAEVEAVDLSALGEVRPPTARREPEVADVVQLVAAAASGRPRLRALVADEHIPTPDRDSGSLSTMQYVRALRRLGHDVDLVIRNDLPFEEHRRALEREGVTVLAEPGPSYDVAMLMRADVFAAFEPRLREVEVGRLVYVSVDLHHRRLAGQADVEGGDGAEAAAYLELERANIAAADLTLVNSTAERDYLGATLPDARVAHVPMARPLAACREADDSRDTEVVFLGGFLHRPNVDAVSWFLDEVWPAVAEAVPQARFAVYGADLPEELAVRGDGRVRMVGHVPTVADAFAQARLTVVPLRYGAGVKGKLVSALMAGVPVVSTSVGVEGLDLPPDAVSVADDAASLATAVATLYADRDRRELQRRRAHELARERFTLDALTARLAEELGR